MAETISSETAKKLPCPAASTTATVSKRKREIVVAVCPSAFPDFATVGGYRTNKQQQPPQKKNYKNNETHHNSKNISDLDFQETVREVHKFGAEGFIGIQAKCHQASEYERLTGRAPKRHKIPTKMIAGMRKKAKEREEKQLKEMKESGIVSLQPAAKRRKQRDKDFGETAGPGVVRGVFGSNKVRNKGDRRKMSSKAFGPSPNVGVMIKGMLKVKQDR